MAFLVVVVVVVVVVILVGGVAMMVEALQVVATVLVCTKSGVMDMVRAELGMVLLEAMQSLDTIRVSCADGTNLDAACREQFT